MAAALEYSMNGRLDAAGGAKTAPKKPPDASQDDLQIGLEAVKRGFRCEAIV